MKKIISFVLLAAMLVALIVPAIHAADAVAISAASAEVMEGGNTVTSAVSLTQNPGKLATVSVIVFWKADANVESVAVSFDSEVLDADNTGAGKIYAGNNKNVKNDLEPFGANTADYAACGVDFTTLEGTTIDTNAVLGSLAFTFADATVKGQKFDYSVAITYACDGDEEDLEYSEDKADATITILEDPNLGKYTDPTLFVVPEKTEIYESDAGTKLKVDVRVDANPGMWGGSYMIVYPNTWTVDSYSFGSIFLEKNSEHGEHDQSVAANQGFLKDRLASFPETPVEGTSYVAEYFESEGEYDTNKSNGILMSYVFNIPADMKIGDKADFRIIYDKEGDFIVNYEDETSADVVFNVVNATVEMCEVKCDHEWGEGVVTTEPTCYSVGVRTYTCPLCTKTKTEEIAMIDHSLTDVVDEATCTTPETTYQKCTNEGCTYKTEAQETAPMLGHDLVLDKNVAATCKEGGYDLYKCTRCEYTEKQNEVGTLPHTPGTPVTQPATCTEDGHTVTLCTECETVLEDIVIPATNHNMVKDELQSYAATCTADGKLVKVCANGCGETTSETLTKLGHDFGDYQVTKEANCTEKGEETRYCSRCEVTETRAIEALGHDWDEGVVTTEPTCTEAGEKLFTCSRCPVTKTEEIAALGHTWDEGVVTKEATETETGVKTYTCTVCEETKEEEIPVVAPEKPEPKEDDKKEEKKEESPKTGDNMVYIIIALAVVILASAAVIVIRRRKEND